jgi:hypothetical protein
MTPALEELGDLRTQIASLKKMVGLGLVRVRVMVTVRLLCTSMPYASMQVCVFVSVVPLSLSFFFGFLLSHGLVLGLFDFCLGFVSSLHLLI